MTKYLRDYPIQWPEFRTKYYRKDEDGWWHPVSRTSKRNK